MRFRFHRQFSAFWKSALTSKLHILTQITIQQSVDEYAEIQNVLKTLPVIKRPVDHAPKLLPRESVSRQIEAFLINDNRDFGLCRFEDKIGGIEATESLLPAEGTLFLTNYRLIFHGTSLEHENRILVRTVPVASIIKVSGQQSSVKNWKIYILFQKPKKSLI